MTSRTNNSSESGGRVDIQIVEEHSSSPPSTPDENAEWTGKLELEMEQALTGQLLSAQLKEETESMICKFPSRRKRFQPDVVRSGHIFHIPKKVAIGPIHRVERRPISDNDKWVIVYLMKEFYNLDFEGCLSKMKNQVANARRRYVKLDNFEDDKSFAVMLLLDSCFILFIMLTIKILERLTDYTLLMPTPNSLRRQLTVLRGDKTRVLDGILDKDSIAPDLLILGNQIPFFVIDELFKELKLEKPLHKYALEYFETIHPLSIEERKEDQNSPPPDFLHLLDLFHWSRVPEYKYRELRPGELSLSPENLHFIDEKSCHIPSAMELRQSATTFEKKMFGSSLDITFRKHRFIPIIRVLDIPELHIRSYSEFIFYNLIAFERHVSSKGCCTMAFAALMRNLLQSEEDVKLLRQHGIFVSSRRNDDRNCPNLFSSKKDIYRLDLFELTKNQQMPSDLSTICDEVQSYHDRVVSRFFRLVIPRCFSNPVVTFSVFVAALSFVPTLLQTINSILSYVHR